MKPKFKVGDKVRILPSAVDIMVAEDEVGKTGVITRYQSLGEDIVVYMDKAHRESGYRFAWCVESSQIELVVVPGQQLLFDFMSETKEER